MNLIPAFPIFENPAPVHYFFETIAFIIGIRVYYFQKKKIEDPISDTNRLWILIGAMIGALIGSRLIAVLETPETLSQLTLIDLYQSKTVAGGFIGGLFGVELIKKIIGVKIASGDVYVFPIIIAVFIGRMGCFISGIAEPTYGIPTSFFTGMDLGDGILRHPVALYEMLYMIGLFFLFRKIKPMEMCNGDRFKLFMVLYFAYRFFVEFIKPYHALWLHLSSIHWSALFIFAYYYRFIVRIYKRLFI
ncbi:MAG: prolipoprotein diacylglyceryl transferase [Flavobacterium sp.]|nr:prolipoprotein diacylglyceryl transferase [Flavobacterium sp.]